MKKTISLILTIAMTFMCVSAFAFFNDIDSDTASWAGEAINELSQKGIINGYGDGTFRPNGNVTRAEFAKMLTLSFKTDAANKTFNDTKDHWAEKYINSAASVMYNPSESFNADSDATRADIAYAVAKALGLCVKDESVSDKFSDFNLVEEEMKTIVAAAIENKVIIGYEDATLKPNNPVTRAEAAVIIFRAINSSVPGEVLPDKPEEIPEPPADEKPSEGVEHIYTLYSGQDFLLVESVSKTNLTVKGEDAFRINYQIAATGKEYSSIIPCDVEVKGLKTSLEEIRPGDVLIVSTAFHGYIGHLYVLASFGESVPSFDSPYSGTGDYTLAYGKVTAVKESGRAAVVSVDNGIQTTDEFVLNNVDVNLYSSWSKASKWTLGDAGDIDTEKGDIYVLIRYTNGASTEVIINNIRK